MKLFKVVKTILKLSLGLLLIAFLLDDGTISKYGVIARAHAFTRSIEFNYADWTLDALQAKLAQAILPTQNYLDEAARHQSVMDYLQLTHDIKTGKAMLRDIYSDPNIDDPEAHSADLRQALDDLEARRSQVAPVAEAILQEQINDTASELGLAVAGQAIPPVLFRATPVPWSLIISPRDAIRQEGGIDLIPELRVEQHQTLEEQVDASLNVSSLVVPIGGVGLYPTMIYETSDLLSLLQVASHEWVHNFLSLRPLGLNYLSGPELRTMNETVASIAGDEIGRRVMEKYYPELLPEPPPAAAPTQEQPAPAEPPAFDFYNEMRITRVRVDELLAKGQVEEAEAYMEERRQFFWENGYHFRKLNQAYFAFHGAYADQPGGGAAGEDPVGAAVREFRQQSQSLAAFLKQIAWIYSFEDLQKTVETRRSFSNN